ncbi:MAG: DUF881 domain-containing protein [Clostridia bacterium]|nr:DUF881 domain-containing protein [Clostridia bacterium]
MKRDKIIVSITLFFMCIILTCVMFMQFRTAWQTNLTDIKNMNEDELKSEIMLWQNRYNEIAQKLKSRNQTIDEYESILQNNDETAKVIDKELHELEKLIGITDVEGDGIVITLEDNKDREVTQGALLNLVNELKYAGGEAISINGIRIINMTDIVDVNYTVQIEGQKLSSPYIIKCIGEQNLLSSTLNSKDGYIQTYTDSGITVKMELQNNIRIDKYNGNLDIKYSND